MLKGNSILVLACLISVAVCAVNSTTEKLVTTTVKPIETTTTTTTATTMAENTTEIITTTTSETTTTTFETTTATATTTTASVNTKGTVLNFTILSNNSEPCMLLRLAVDMTIRYTAEDEGTMKNESLTVGIPAEYNDYSGVCDEQLNSLRLHFWNDWYWTVNFTMTDDRYELSSMSLDYFVNSTWFPKAAKSSSGTFNATVMNLHEFPANKGSSYKCKADTKIELSPLVTFDITHYQGEPFYKKDQNKDVSFHTAVDCQADQVTTSKLIPIIIGSALAVLVLLVLVAYLVGRRKHRTGYQSV